MSERDSTTRVRAIPRCRLGRAESLVRRGLIDGSSTIISGATVYDGSAAMPVTSDVLIRGEQILAVEPDIARTGAVVVDGRSLAVAPGFIDMHSHADFTLPAYPAAHNSLSQGVTTEVLGNCGWSPAPLSATNLDHRERWQKVARALGPDLSWAWTTFAEYLSHLDGAHAAVNSAVLVGHSAIRSATYGIDDRPPTPAELASMRQLLDEALTAGAWGMSTGLVYPPSSFAQADEIEALAADVSSRGALYSTHMRDEGDELVTAVQEAIDVSRRTGVRVQISHLKAAGPRSHGTIRAALDMIDAARETRLKVGCDAYPYLAGSTVLTQLVPAWAMVGGVAELLNRLRSEEMRERIRAEIRQSPSAYVTRAGGWSQVMICRVENEALRRFEGRFLPEIAGDLGKTEADVLFDLLLDDLARTTMIVFLMDETDVETVLDHPSTVVGSDQLGVHSATARVHPRAYGTFARAIARAARGDEASLSTAIAKATGRTASRLGLPDRGFVRPGHVADLVIFDPQTIADVATYENPTKSAVGIDSVFLAGRAAIAGGEVVDASLGRVLRRGHRPVPAGKN